MHTIEVPINRGDFISFIEKNKRKIKRKNVEEQRPKGSYYRFGTFKSSGVYKSFAECEEEGEGTTHIQLKINDKKLFYEAKVLFKGKENWSYDFDETEDVKLSKSRPKSTWTFYDRTERDNKMMRKDDSEAHTHSKIRMEYANNDNDLYEELSDDWRESRLELKLLNPGTKRTKTIDFVTGEIKEVTPPPLDALDAHTYIKICDDLEGRIKPITIVLIRPNVTNGVYINYCRKMQQKQKNEHKKSQRKAREEKMEENRLARKKGEKGEEFVPTEFIPAMVPPNKHTQGRMLKPVDYSEEIKSELDIIKTYFVK